MSDNKPTPTENQEADTFVGRLSVVVMCLASIVSVMSMIVLTQPDLSSTRHSFWGNVFIIFALGWLAYLSIVYLFGRFKEASKMCSASIFGGQPMPFFTLSSVPFSMGAMVYVPFWLLWRLPDGMTWVAEFFRN
jgi:hypothetical protein